MSQQIKCPIVLSHKETLLKKLRFNLVMIQARANDGMHHYDTDEIETIKAEMYYLRQYLNETDEILQNLFLRHK